MGDGFVSYIYIYLCAHSLTGAMNDSGESLLGLPGCYLRCSDVFASNNSSGPRQQAAHGSVIDMFHIQGVDGRSTFYALHSCHDVDWLVRNLCQVE